MFFSTGQRPWCWSCWQQFAWSEGATRSFSLHLTTSRRLVVLLEQNLGVPAPLRIDWSLLIQLNSLQEGFSISCRFPLEHSVHSIVFMLIKKSWNSNNSSPFFFPASQMLLEWDISQPGVIPSPLSCFPWIWEKLVLSTLQEEQNSRRAEGALGCSRNPNWDLSGTKPRNNPGSVQGTLPSFDSHPAKLLCCFIQKYPRISRFGRGECARGISGWENIWNL